MVTFDLENILGRLAIIWLLMVSICSGVSAQNYKSLPIHSDFIYPERGDFGTDKEFRDESRKVKSRLSEARSTVSEAVKDGSANFGLNGDKYMLQFRLASMTQTEDRYLSQLGEMRADFMKLYLDRSSTAVRRSVISKILPELEKISLDQDYHPAVRLNAVSMIGLLDDRAGSSSGPPIPSTAAYGALKKIWSSANSSDAVRAGALSGIRRFAEISRRSDSEQSIAGDVKSEMIAILSGTARGQDSWKPDFDYWMKRRATQILGFIGEGGDVVDAVSTVMKQAQKEGERDVFWLRYDGLVALANLKFRQLDRKRVPALIDDVLGFISDSLESEAARLQSQIDDLV